MIKQRATLSICHLCSGFLHFFDVSTHVESTYSIDSDDHNNDGDERDDADTYDDRDNDMIT